MKRTILSEELTWTLFIILALAITATPVAVSLVYSSKYDFLYVPIASWFVFVLVGAALTLGGVASYWLWRRLCRTSQDLTDLTGQPLEDRIPAVCGHKHVDQAEFLTIIQVLFKRFPDVRYVQVKPLPGGYGGSTTVSVKLRREQSDAPLPRSFVIKLGDRREMAGEHEKFHEYVEWRLTRRNWPTFLGYAEWEEFAGIAYEFVGLDPDHEIRSFYQFYKGHATIEVSELIGGIYSHLGRAWYRNGRKDSTNLYHEYNLLSKKQRRIIEHVGEIVDEDDPYRRNFTVIGERIQPNLKPNFCSEMDIPWHDPVAFLRTWPSQNLTVPIFRSIVHGDLNARNVLVEIGREGHKHAWFIDFSHTGNGLSEARTKEASREGTPIDPDRGHTLRDFCRLEADVKFILTRLENKDDLGLAVAFEGELMDSRRELDDLPATPSLVEALTDERFQKAWQVVREIRRQAAKYLTSPGDLRPYYLSLLHATLPILYYHPDQFENETCERQQKRYALISAGMLCDKL
ncbi:MAG: lipopolysaccharide kinase InaA family protein [Chloroflexota bacterium]|nr:lipopolysaccharide kinase InaA family protein [Chloroflexota bacterium]